MAGPSPYLVVDYWLPAQQERTPAALFGARLVAVSLLGAALAFLGFCGIQWKAGNESLTIAQGAAAVLAVVLLVALRRGVPTPLVAHGLIILVNAQIALVSILLGGVELPALAFYGVSPLVALLASGPRAAVAWFLVGATVIIGLNVAQAAGVEFPVAPPRQRWVDAFALVTLSALTLFFASAYASLSRRALQALHTANSELGRARAVAEDANAAKDRFVTNVSHELRTSLTGSIGFSRILAEAELAPPFKDYARTALACGETVLAIVNDILDQARLDSGRLELQRVDFDLHRVLDEVRLVADAGAREKGVAFALTVDAPRWVSGDPLRLKQVMLNLISNAVKFTLRGSIELRARAFSDGVELSVQDTGIGIPADVVGRLFQPFSQGDASTARRFGGTGLGLAIANEIVAAMGGGSIRVRSEPGVGSTFAFTVPLPPAPAPTAPIEAQKLRAGLRILVVDDVPTNRLLAARYLEQLGAVVVAAASGAEALEQLSGGTFDAAFVDCEMPELDGYETVRRIRATEKGAQRMPIIALTASAFPDDLARCLAAGMDGLVSKPFGPEALRDGLLRHPLV